MAGLSIGGNFAFVEFLPLYERTVVELDLGEEWFCTEEEAIEAGYRKSEHCFD